jgi:thymidine kinase
MLNNGKVGRIDVIIGCMYSGKTTEVIRQINIWKSIGKNVLSINHTFDDRYSEKNDICSHDIIKSSCIKVKNLKEVSSELINNADVIVVDEAQFFPDLVDNCVKWCEEYGKDIIVSGLDGDFNRQPFLDCQLLKLIPYAETVTKCEAFCQLCKNGTLAPFSWRTTDSKDQIKIGSTGDYIAVCRKHRKELENKKN